MENKLLFNCLEKLNIDTSEKQVNLLNLYINEIIKWNRRTNLVKADRNELIKYHISDSIAGLKYIREYAGSDSALIADLGSGAGLPGIPLSIFMPSCKFYLIERSSKRAAFLRNVSILLKAENIEVIEEDIKNIDMSFDIVLFRAFTPLEKHMNNFKRILRNGGHIIAYKAVMEKIVTELKKVKCRYSIIPLSLPFSDRKRHLVILSGL
jgi:16S rRNA (guanine527-N7)-methyltransferase